MWDALKNKMKYYRLQCVTQSDSSLSAIFSTFWLRQEPKESRCRVCVRDIIQIMCDLLSALLSDLSALLSNLLFE